MAPAKKANAKGMKKETKVALEVGAAALAAAAAGAGYYFYGDKGAKKHRAAASKWAKGMKADVVKEAKKVKKLDQQAMTKIVDAATAAYSTARSVNKSELSAAARELKKNWKTVQAELTGVARKAVGGGKKAAKKSVSSAKKTVKKSAPKKAAAKKGSKKA